MTNSSSSSTKLKALLKKNITIMLRNCCTFVAEILFPIILMLIIFAIRQAFKVKTHKFEDKNQLMKNFLKNVQQLIYQITPFQRKNGIK